MFLEVFFVAAAGWLLFGSLETQSRVQRINRALEEGRPYDFLRDIDQELERRPSGPLFELLKLNRSAGLVYIGEFDEALVALRSVDRKKLSSGWWGRHQKFTDALYYNNLLYTLLCAKRYQEAVEVWSESAEKIVPRTNHPLLDHCLKGTAATYQYHCGDLPIARETLERLLQEANIPRLYKAHPSITWAASTFSKAVSSWPWSASKKPPAWHPTVSWPKNPNDSPWAMSEFPTPEPAGLSPCDHLALRPPDALLAFAIYAAGGRDGVEVFHSTAPRVSANSLFAGGGRFGPELRIRGPTVALGLGEGRARRNPTRPRAHSSLLVDIHLRGPHPLESQGAELAGGWLQPLLAEGEQVLAFLFAQVGHFIVASGVVGEGKTDGQRRGNQRLIQDHGSGQQSDGAFS